MTNVVKLPDRSAIEAWNSFDLNFIANPFKQMAAADNAHLTQQQILLQLKKMASDEGRPLADLHKEYGVHERSPLQVAVRNPPQAAHSTSRKRCITRRRTTMRQRKFIITTCTITIIT